MKSLTLDDVIDTCANVAIGGALTVAAGMMMIASPAAAAAVPLLCISGVVTVASIFVAGVCVTLKGESYSGPSFGEMWEHSNRQRVAEERKHWDAYFKKDRAWNEAKRERLHRQTLDRINHGYYDCRF